jgi:hypothetical protein
MYSITVRPSFPAFHNRCTDRNLVFPIDRLISLEQEALAG